jgi:hypothetical protein
MNEERTEQNRTEQNSPDNKRYTRRRAVFTQRIQNEKHFAKLMNKTHCLFGIFELVRNETQRRRNNEFVGFIGQRLFKI